MSIRTFAVVGSAVFLASAAIAGICDSITGTGYAAVEIEAPPSVDYGALESNTEIFVFSERPSLALPSAVYANITEPGDYSGSSGSHTPGWISAGTVVNSYLMHFDAVGQEFMLAQGSVTFDSPVLGLLIGNEELFATDDLLGSSITTYPTKDGRGLSGEDSITLSDNRRTVTVTMLVNVRASVQGADRMSATRL